MKNYWRCELQAALEAPELAAFDNAATPGPEAAGAAYRLALCLGYCRLFGVGLPSDIDGVMSAREAMAAARMLISNVSVWAQCARELPARCNAAPAGVGAALCADLLQAWMDSWAVFQAVSEAHEECVCLGGPDAQEFDLVIDRTMDALDRFDSTLQGRDVLSNPASSQLVENWRHMLAPGYFPWWLTAGHGTRQ
jgi:hypothetical protein